MNEEQKPPEKTSIWIKLLFFLALLVFIASVVNLMYTRRGIELITDLRNKLNQEPLSYVVDSQGFLIPKHD